jgi:hypothetical protein
MSGIQPSEIRSDWLVEPLRSSDPADARRISLGDTYSSQDEVEQFPTEWTPEFRAEWDRFLKKAAPGDAIWFFRSPRDTWDELGGREGFVIMRDGTPIAAIVTVLS